MLTHLVVGIEMRASLESKNKFSNSNITKIEDMKYLDKQITTSVKITMYEGNNNANN